MSVEAHNTYFQFQSNMQYCTSGTSITCKCDADKTRLDLRVKGIVLLNKDQLHLFFKIVDHCVSIIRKVLK